MTWTPISGAPIQYQKSDGTLASGYYLKAYEAGTTTPLSMATDSTGGTTLAKCQINSSGYPITAGSAVFIPHLNQDYKIVLYKNSTDADADTTANADWEVDNVPVYEVGSDEVWGTFAGAPTQTSAITFTLTGDQTSTFSVGTKLKLTDASTIYGIVTAVSFSSVTTVTVLATADLSGSLSAVEYAKTYDDGQTKGLVLDARTYVVTSSRTITNDFVIPKGCLLNISSSQTLTITGYLEAGLYQIFSGSGVVRGFDATTVHPEWWGAVADGSTNDKPAIMAMFAYAEAKTSSAVDGCHIKFQPRKYAIASNLTYKGNNTIIEGYGATIKYTEHATTTGYLADCLVIGNKNVADGEDGTNSSPFTYVTNTHVKGFHFELPRIGCYAVYCKSCSFEDLSGDGLATLALGNDASGGSPCYDCHVKNIRQTDWRYDETVATFNFYGVGFFFCEDCTLDGFYSVDATMAGATATAKQITLNNCKRCTVENFHIDGVDKTSGGFEVISTNPSSPSTHCIVRDGIVRRCILGGTFFNAANGTEFCTLDNVKFIDNVNNFQLSAAKCYIENNKFLDADTNDLVVDTDASRCIIRNNVFTGTIFEESSNLLPLHAWDGNIGGGSIDQVRAYKGIDGTFPYEPRGAYAYYLGPQSNITGNGTYATLSSFTSSGELDESGYLDNSTGIYTLPTAGVGGIFECKAAILLVGLTAAATVVELFINIGGTRRLLDYHLNYGTSHGVSQCWLKGDLTTTIGAGGTIKFEVRVQGEASDVVDTAGSLGYISITEQMGY